MKTIFVTLVSGFLASSVFAFDLHHAQPPFENHDLLKESHQIQSLHNPQVLIVRHILGEYVLDRLKIRVYAKPTNELWYDIEDQLAQRSLGGSLSKDKNGLTAFCFDAISGDFWVIRRSVITHENLSTTSNTSDVFEFSENSSRQEIAHTIRKALNPPKEVFEAISKVLNSTRSIKN